MSKRLYLALAAAGAALLAFLGLTRCPAPDPVTPPAAIASPMPAPQAEATSSAAATATGTLKATIRRPIGPHAPQIKSENLHNGPEAQAGSDGPHARDFEEIVIEVSQTATAAASSEASAAAEAPSLEWVRREEPRGRDDHARLGVMGATVPGAIAITYQLMAVELPPWLLGTPLELGLDAAVNLEAGALGVTAGQKAFAGAYYWSRWSLSDHGPAIAVGLRF